MLDEGHQQVLKTVRTALGDDAATGLDDASLLALELSALTLDSLSKLDLILKLEEASAQMLDEVEIAGCRTVEDLVRLAARSRA
jgi:acyl carrier protein